MNKLFVLIITSTLLACGKSSSPSKPTRTTDEIEGRTLDITQYEVINFHRREQMTSRYNCKNELTSRKLETLNNLSKKLTVDYPHRKKAWSFSVFNRRTRSSNRGAFVGMGKFVVDYAPTVFNMHVKEGINKVEYSFSKCTETGKDEEGNIKCIGDVILEKEGIVQIDVFYSSEVIPGERFFYPSPKECKPQS